MKREDIRGGADRLRYLEEMARRLEKRFPPDDPLGIWAQETRSMIRGLMDGHRRGYATFLDPIRSLLRELRVRGLRKKARPFRRLVVEVNEILAGPSLGISEWEFGITGGDASQCKEDKS